MEHTDIKAVVLPAYPFYLETLVHREDTFTTMVWGWQKNPKRMATPHRVLHREQSYLPFLLSPTDQDPKAVTHTAVCGLLLHREEIPPDEVAQWLSDKRVEHFALDDKDVDWGTKDAASFYVVTATRPLAEPIPYDNLYLVKGVRPLSNNKKRGYAIVFLPSILKSWYLDACQKWDHISMHLPEDKSREPSDG